MTCVLVELLTVVGSLFRIGKRLELSVFPLCQSSQRLPPLIRIPRFHFLLSPVCLCEMASTLFEKKRARAFDIEFAYNSQCF